MTDGRYRVGVDIGGTFTDCVVAFPDGRRSIAKSPTTPGRLDEGVVAALTVNAAQMGIELGALLSSTDVLVHGTTQGTNAVLSRTGSRTGLLTTRGHEDHLIIGRVYSKMAGLDERALVHASRLEKPDPIVPRGRTFGITERIDRDGEVLVPLDEAEVVAALDALVADGVEAVAVSLLWSFANDAHERRIKEIFDAQGVDMFMVLSHEIAPVLGEYERTATTALTAYVGPTVVSYLDRLQSRLRADGLANPMLVMQASGGLISVADAAQNPLLTLDSGPTGGILGCQYLGELYNEPNVICTDVGGTSFDVGLISRGEIPLDEAPVVAQYTLRMPKVLVRSIGAGGGSVVWVDEGGLLRVGPQSAGADPGPACYGRGGTQATVTDADVVLGIVDPDRFLGGRMPLDRDRAVSALAEVGQGIGMDAEAVALGVFRIVNAQMADLIRKATIEQGHDPRRCVLAAYGGAGPSHAVFYGQNIGVKSILVPSDSTVYSAAGMLTCDLERSAEISRRASSPFQTGDVQAIKSRFEQLEGQLRESFSADQPDAPELKLTWFLGVRFRAQVQSMMVAVTAEDLEDEIGDRILELFVHGYTELYGDAAHLSGGGIEVEHQRVVAISPLLRPEALRENLTSTDSSEALRGERPVCFDEQGYVATAVYDGGLLRAGNLVRGPAIIERMGDSLAVPRGWQASLDEQMTFVVSAGSPSGKQGSVARGSSNAS